MPVNTTRIRDSLRMFDLSTLFIEELGWDRFNTRPSQITVGGASYTLVPVTEKRGFQVFVCTTDAIPNRAERLQIYRELVKRAHEHLIIFADAAQTTQQWQWVRAESGRQPVLRGEVYRAGSSGERLVQKLAGLAVTLEEEEQISLLEVAGHTRRAFDVERVTKRFYDRFKDEHKAFLGFLKGIPDEGLQRWYASVMLNRLMFIYFIQRKGFLNNDREYLRTKLAQSQARGSDRFYNALLCPLFFEGFACKPADRAPETRRLLGDVPYLNGGLFMRHQIEQAHGQTIRIADATFERLFDFFDEYQWHLDERPLRDEREINPDVLGYIFEKYINQKEMGAYYTREDITEYITKNTIIPFLFDSARRRAPGAFGTEGALWRLLATDPDRYIYPAVRHGADLGLPPEIAAGLDDVSRRGEWNRAAPAEYALPTEIWREVAARRRRYADLRAMLAAGAVGEINDLITANLDIRRFAQDMVESCDDPEVLRAFWKAIESVTVLDPTCGSGAFLFAALNILEPLYDACLERMQLFLDELATVGTKHRPEKFSDFRAVLERVAEHPNRRYFILKSIIVNNLYGVDIMEEAVEICKLRLFLKLVSQIEASEQIEPLPDIDFNIRADNTLVGFATREEVRQALTTLGAQSRMLFEDDLAALQRIEEYAADVDRLFALFRRQQTELGGEVTAADKQALRDRLDALAGERNQALARQYGVDPSRNPEYTQWLSSHQPFHWFIEYHGIQAGVRLMVIGLF